MIDPFDFPSREVGLVLSALIFVLAVVGFYARHRMNGSASPPLRYGLTVVLILSTLRMYSASSFIWGPEAADAGLLPVFRYVVVGLLTLALIVMLALVGFYWRRAKGTR